MNYWQNKENLKKKAAEHTKKMEALFSEEIALCRENAAIYRRFEPFEEPVVKVIDKDSVTAAFEEEFWRTAILNFASYKNPGGLFLEGSSAQEESLCHRSYLYNVLREFTDTYYKENCGKKNKGLYTNAAIYLKDVRFFLNDEEKLFDVITCAAPNYTAAEKYCNVSREENSRCLKDRIRFVLNTAERENVDTLILGAYGCGVFGQDPEEAAELFKELIPGHSFKKIIFAIPDANSKNHIAFAKAF